MTTLLFILLVLWLVGDLRVWVELPVCCQSAPDDAGDRSGLSVGASVHPTRERPDELPGKPVHPTEDLEFTRRYVECQGLDPSGWTADDCKTYWSARKLWRDSEGDAALPEFWTPQLERSLELGDVPERTSHG